MNIKDIIKLDVNKTVQGTFTVKTAKKIWKDSDGYVHQVLLSDDTGDMLADCFVGDFTKIQRGTQIDLLEAMTQHGENGIRLYVQMWEYSGEPISEPPELEIYDKVVRGKTNLGNIPLCLTKGIAQQRLHLNNWESSFLISSSLQGSPNRCHL